MVVSNRIARAFNRSVATQAVALDISKAFDRVWHAGLLHKLKSYGIQIFGLISLVHNIKRLWVVWDGKSSQDYPVNAVVSQRSILGPTLCYYTLMTFLMMFLSMLMILLSTLNVIRHLIWQQLELASELESDLQEQAWGRKWLIVDFKAGKTQLVWFDQSKNTGAIDVKMGGSVLEEE